MESLKFLQKNDIYAKKNKRLMQTQKVQNITAYFKMGAYNLCNSKKGGINERLIMYRFML